MDRFTSSTWRGKPAGFIREPSSVNLQSGVATKVNSKGEGTSDYTAFKKNYLGPVTRGRKQKPHTAGTVQAVRASAEPVNAWSMDIQRAV